MVVPRHDHDAGAVLTEKTGLGPGQLPHARRNLSFTKKKGPGGFRVIVFGVLLIAWSAASVGAL